MEIHKNLSSVGYQNPNIDTSRPFRSVKEAAEIFGGKFLVKEICSPKPFNISNQETPCFYTQSPSPNKTQSEISVFDSNNDLKMVESLKKLQEELNETKMELRLLKERESETEVALASLNAEVHKNMSKLARAEADAASNALIASRSAVRWEKSSIALAQILSGGEENEGLNLFGGDLNKKEKKVMMKKKPVIPLVGDLFWKKKGSANTVQYPLFASHSSLI